MKVIEATHMGNGVFEARGSLDRKLASEGFPVGASVKLRVTSPRSNKQMRFFFAYLKAAYENLPEDCELHFHDPEHLRAYLLYKTGHAEITVIPVDVFTMQIARLLQKMTDRYLFFERWKDSIYVYEPQSIAFTNMDHETFTRFFKQAKEIVTVELIPGIDPQLLEARATEMEE